MSPNDRTDHELLLAILDEMKTIREFVRASSAAIWGKQDDSTDQGLVGRVAKLEVCAEANEKRSTDNDKRLDGVSMEVRDNRANIDQIKGLLKWAIGVSTALLITVLGVVVVWILSGAFG